MSFLSALGSLVSNVTNGVAQLDLHPLLHNAASELLEGLVALVAIDVAWYGAVGDGVTDDTAAFQAALDAASASAFGKWVYAKATATGYLLADQLTIPPYVTLMGSHAFLSQRGGRSFATAGAQQMPGTVLLMSAFDAESGTWMGYGEGLDSDDPEDGWLTLERAAGLVGVQLSDPQNAAVGMPGEATEPTPRPWAIVCQGGGESGNSGQTIRNVFLDCVYRGTRIYSDKMTIDGLTGYALLIFLEADRIGDVSRWQGIRAFPAADRVWDGSGALDVWVHANGTSYRLGRVDGLDCSGLFSFGYGVGLELFDSGEGAPFGQITNLELDGTRIGIWCRAVALTGLRITGGLVFSSFGPDPLNVLFDLGTGTNGMLSFDGVAFKGSQSTTSPRATATNLVRVPRSCGSGKLSFGNCRFYLWDATAAGAAIQFDSLRAALVADEACDFLQTGTYVLDVSGLSSADGAPILIGGHSSLSDQQAGIKYAPSFSTTLSGAITSPGQQAVTLGSTAGLVVGQRLAFVGSLATFTTTAINATGSQSVTLLDPTGVAVGQMVTFGSDGVGGTAETVAITAVAGSVVTATFGSTHAAGTGVTSGAAEPVTVEAINGNQITGTFVGIHDAGSPVTTGRKPVTDEWTDGLTMGRIARRLNIWDTVNGALLHMKGPGATTPSVWQRVTSNGTWQLLNHKASTVQLALTQAGVLNVNVGETHAKGGLSIGLDPTAANNNATIRNYYSASKTWDPANVADGGQTSTTITVTGAAVGNPCTAGFNPAVPAGAILQANVTVADTVTVTLVNHSGAPLDLGNGTLRVGVFQH